MTTCSKTDLRGSDVTPKEAYLNRRQIMAGTGALIAAGAIGGAAPMQSWPPYPAPIRPRKSRTRWKRSRTTTISTNSALDKTDPAAYAHTLTTDPWSIEIDGMVDKPGTYALDDICSRACTLEERIYRFRCVEAWSMVIPWDGFPLKTLLDKAGVQPSAKYVAFQTLLRPEEMPGQRSRILDWPYRRGAADGRGDAPADHPRHRHLWRADAEAGRRADPAGGAVEIWLQVDQVDRQDHRWSTEMPPTTWNDEAPSEYGFYANVNPQVDHPRWSQATERRIGGGPLRQAHRTLMFNGYGDQVAASTPAWT